MIDPFLLDSGGHSFVLLSILIVVFGPNDSNRNMTRNIKTFLKSITHGSAVDIDSIYFPKGRIIIDDERTPPIMSRQYFDLLMIQGTPNHFPWTNARINYVRLHYPLSPIAGCFVGLPCKSMADSIAIQQQQGFAGKFQTN